MDKSEPVEVLKELKKDILDSEALKKADLKQERRAYRNLKNKANGGFHNASKAQ